MCGAAIITARCIGSSSGLSPRVRGSPRARLLACATLRSIPTCAGQPGFGHTPPALGWVYPHVCGAAPIIIHTSIP